MALILLADDHLLVRDAIAMVLSEMGRHDLILADSVCSAVEMVDAGRRPELVILDFRMPGMAGLAGVRRMRDRLPGVPVALLSGTPAGAIAPDALAAGAAGFISKTLLPAGLLGAVDQLLAGQTYFAPDAGPDPEGPALTRREYQVLRGLANGLANKEIARDLEISEVTVKLHVQSVCRKLDARNRTHAAIMAMRLGLL
ncbi:hypothetical protein ATO6_11490 [Oceanicola sp. 22II-s10i]|uniref:response regulator transcription factor n=1 Tax=Oceanicola sp. 22II-s10i TaxID=1317116 RepID=UPI000B521FC8|nr:response regulator transcription factor [Oceanicola sp. 22II-s10i]OWU84920.1 hypothetical protein ATO6_11490 [Oceanicola sp. 22II-s10i]